MSNGDNLPRITPFRLGGGLDYRHERWLGAVDAIHVLEQNHNATLETETDGYTLLELSAGWTYHTAPADYLFTVRGSNLLNEEGAPAYDVAPLPGRSAMLNLRVVF